ncbi:UbiA family prenyltransferase [Pseudokineococcus sp. 5B2Z-1]|uniref:UbiA family prenyltransferase n=1 Tax=Pseudokineococcus sp. 5B2Z-1 TaxID=3132744 RepID=UPI003095EDFD
MRPAPGGGLGTWRDWAELVRLPAVVSVPGDALTGLAAAGGVGRPGTAAPAAVDPAAVPPAAVVRATAAPLASVCLYWGGMVLNDWADRELDAVERPERPLPSGRVAPPAALAAAGALTAVGVGVAGLAGGRRSAGCAALLAAAVWTYDLVGKSGPLAPASMAVTRLLDVVLGATAAAPGIPLVAALRPAALPALSVGLHTLAVTDLARGEVHGATPAAARRAAAVSTAAGVASAAAGVAAAVGAVRRGGGRVPAVAGAVLGVVASAAHVARLVPVQAGAGTGAGGDARAATVAGLRALVTLQASLLAGLRQPVTAAGVLALGAGGKALRRFGSAT